MRKRAILGGSGSWLLDLLLTGQDYKTTMGGMVSAGDQGDEFIVVAYLDAGVVKGFGLDLIDAIVKFFFGLGIDEVIELKNVGFRLEVQAVVEGCHNLVLILFVDGVEGNGGMLLPVGLVLKLQKAPEHTAIGHIVGIDHQILAVGLAVDVNERGTGIAVGAIEGGVEVLFAFAGGVHNGVIDLGAINGEPAEEFVVLFVELFVLGQDLSVATTGCQHCGHFGMHGQGCFCGFHGGAVGVCNSGGSSSGRGGSGSRLSGHLLEVLFGAFVVQQEAADTHQYNQRRNTQTQQDGFEGAELPAAFPGTLGFPVMVLEFTVVAI